MTKATKFSKMIKKKALNPKSDISSRKTDPEFFQKLFRTRENGSFLEVNAVNETPACPQGVNFMSNVRRIRVSGKRRNGAPYEISLISKSIIEDKAHQEVFQSLKIFANEARVYRALPVLLGNDQKLVPKSLYVDKEYILLEDLTSAGFLMPDKMKGLDLEHAKLVLETLAKFHAASFELEYAEPKKYAKIREEDREVVFTPGADHEGMKSMLDSIPAWTIFHLKAGATAGDDHAKEIAYFEGKTGKIYEILKKLIQPKRYAVMCVGDCWISNLLFRYDEVTKAVVDVRLLDFQSARFTSVAIDILYFLHTSVIHGVIEERLDEMLETYHSVLIANLKSVPREVSEDLSMEWLKNELKTHELYGFFTSLWVAPVTTVKHEYNIDGTKVAELVAEKKYTEKYMEDRISPALLTRIQQKCKYFLK